MDAKEQKLMENLYNEVLIAIKYGKFIPVNVEVACEKISEKRARTFIDRLYDKVCTHLPKKR
jgi:hydrogenase maturation factor